MGVESFPGVNGHVGVPRPVVGSLGGNPAAALILAAAAFDLSF